MLKKSNISIGETSVGMESSIRDVKMQRKNGKRTRREPRKTRRNRK